MDVGEADSEPGRFNRGASSAPGGPRPILPAYLGRRKQNDSFSSEREESGKRESNERGP